MRRGQRKRAHRRVDAAFQVEVADTYAAAMRAGENPRQAVAALGGGVPWRTAAYWISKTRRESGLIGPTRQGTAGGVSLLPYQERHGDDRVRWLQSEIFRLSGETPLRPASAEALQAYLDELIYEHWVGGGFRRETKPGRPIYRLAAIEVLTETGGPPPSADLAYMRPGGVVLSWSRAERVAPPPEPESVPPE